ncbi:MAG: hypothetical protein EA381_05140 [Planctomycetaceae bacterium]|nr:MAG: hypothetical protein EA381_05140 [Planctomycetaceae bacterium]
MAFSVQDLWFRLIGLGMIDARQAESWAARSAASAKAAGADPNDPLVIAKLLIEQRVLTSFQAKQILSGRGEELVQGDYQLLERIKRIPLGRWYRARHLPTDRLALVCPCGYSGEARDHVDPNWLLPHVAVEADGLQPLAWVELDRAPGAPEHLRRGLVLSRLPDGQTLTQWLDRPESGGNKTALAIGEVVGGALVAMHRASLFHGGVRPGRIWVAGDGSVFLLRCGGGPPIFPGDPVAPGYDWFEDDGQAGLFAAPEWLAGRTHADAATDVCSLGKLLYQVATGKLPPPQGLPPEAVQAVAAGAAGDPLMRVLAAAMQPDRAERFADVEGFLRALRAAGELLFDQPVQVPASPRQAVEPVVAPIPTPRPDPAPISAPTPAPSPVSAGPADRPSKTVGDRAAPEIAATSAPDSRSTQAAVPTRVAETRVDPVSTKSRSNTPAATDPATAAKSANPSSPTGSEPAVKRSPERSPAAPARPAAGRAVRRRKRRNLKGPIVVGATSAGILLVLLAFLVLRQPPAEPPSRPRPTPRPTPPVAQQSGSEDSELSSAASATGDRFEIVQDDRVLWAPPWPADSAPPPLDLLVPGAQTIVSFRPGLLLRADSPADWRGWFGPELEPALADLSRRFGVDIDGIDRLTLSLLAGQDGEAEAAWAVQLATPIRLQELKDRWGASASQTADGEVIWATESATADVFFIPGENLVDETEVTAFATGGLEAIRWVAEGGGGPIPLPRALQTAWDSTSQTAEIVALISPNFLFADGREILKRYAPRAIEPLRNALIPDVMAVAVALDTQRDFYVEVRMIPGGTASSAKPLHTLRELISGLPEAAEALLVGADIAASWKLLAIRLPQSLRAVRDQTRFGISDSQATANLYLPAPAAPQLTLASLLALSAVEGAVADVSVAAVPAGQMKSMDELLASPLSISFEQESLEFAINMIGEEFAGSLPAEQPRPQIVILGGDLEKSGITQNQQVRDFKLRDVPLREALTRLVAGANPDKTATSPADEKQSLVWVVDPNSTDTAPALLITTRPEAANKGYVLPQEFTASP